MKSTDPQKSQQTTTFKQKITDVIKQAMGDITEMCSFDKNGKSLYEIKIKKQKQQKTNKDDDDQGQQFIDYLIANKKIIGSCLDLDVNMDEEQIEEEGMRIWRQVKEKNRGYVISMCRSKQKGGEQNSRVSLKMEDSEMM